MSLPNTLVPGYLALTSVRNVVPLAHPGSIYLFQGEHRILHLAMQELVDRFAIQEPVQVIVGGNRVSFDHLPLIVGDQAGRIYEIIDHISISRAESCYQMLDALASIQAGPQPLVITDMLDPFYEKDLTIPEVTLLLKKCLRRIQHLSLLAPILISANGNSLRPNLLELLETNSDTRFSFQPIEEDIAELQMAFPEMR